jgi:transposase InsO family protein
MKREQQETVILRQVERVRKVLPGLGGKKLYAILKQTEVSENMCGFGRDKLFRLLGSSGLLIRRKRRVHVPGTDSSHTSNVYENLKKDRVIRRSDELIESDMTAIRIKECYKPLAICMDVYSRKILGWKLSPNWSAMEAVKALREANQESGQKLIGSIHHSDRGSQYGSDLYREEIALLGMEGSMSRKATPTDEAHIERLNRTLKREFNLRRRFSSFEEAEEAIYCAVLTYNEIRPHWSLGLRTPAQAYAEGKRLTKEPNPFRATPSMG